MKYILLGGPLLFVFNTSATKTTKDKIYALEMEEFVILHQILNHKNIVFSVQVVSGNANLTFALIPISLLIIYLLFTVR